MSHSNLLISEFVNIYNAPAIRLHGPSEGSPLGRYGETLARRLPVRLRPSRSASVSARTPRSRHVDSPRSRGFPDRDAIPGRIRCLRPGDAALAVRSGGVRPVPHRARTPSAPRRFYRVGGHGASSSPQHRPPPVDPERTCVLGRRQPSHLEKAVVTLDISAERFPPRPRPPPPRLASARRAFSGSSGCVASPFQGRYRVCVQFPCCSALPQVRGECPAHAV